MVLPGSVTHIFKVHLHSGKSCSIQIPSIASWKPGRHPMTSIKGVPYIMAENVVYRLDIKKKAWLAIARIPGSESSAYRVSNTPISFQGLLKAH